MALGLYLPRPKTGSEDGGRHEGPCQCCEPPWRDHGDLPRDRAAAVRLPARPLSRVTSAQRTASPATGTSSVTGQPNSPRSLTRSQTRRSPPRRNDPVMSTATVPHPPSYPVHVDADAAPVASRWLWLVKWLLALPHYIVLVFLWLAFVVLSIGRLLRDPVHRPLPPGASSTSTSACCAGRWRVTYYAYGALGTDRYPPFTLAEVAGLPGPPRRRLPRAPLARTGAGQVVAARHPALPDRRPVRRRRCVDRARRRALAAPWAAAA